MVIHDGLRAMAEREPDLNMVGAVAHLSDASDLIARLRPDVVILDLRIDEESSIDTCAAITTTFPDVKVLMFSGHGNAELLRQSIRAGAAGYLLKDTNTSHLPGILRDLMRTGSYYDSRLSGSLLRSSVSRKPTDAFNARELLIVAEIARGANNYDIGEHLNISSHTVKFHISAMLKRHSLQSRSELVRLAMSMQLLD